MCMSPRAFEECLEVECLPLIEDPPLYALCVTVCAYFNGDPPEDVCDAEAAAMSSAMTRLLHPQRGRNQGAPPLGR
jgi:hypothetical protein